MNNIEDKVGYYMAKNNKVRYIKPADIQKTFKTSITAWTNGSDLTNYGVEDERVDNKAASAAQCFLSF